MLIDRRTSLPGVVSCWVEVVDIERRVGIAGVDFAWKVPIVTIDLDGLRMASFDGGCEVGESCEVAVEVDPLCVRSAGSSGSAESGGGTTGREVPTEVMAILGCYAPPTVSISDFSQRAIGKPVTEAFARRSGMVHIILSPL